MTSGFEDSLVGDVMSGDVLTVAAEETALMAWELMRQGGYHHVPVLGSNGHCIGVLDAETMASAWDGGGPDRMRMPVSAVVGRPPPRVCITDSVAATARTMLAADRDFVAVTDGEGRLVGLVTARDLVAAVAGQRHRAAAGRVRGPALYRIEPVLPSAHAEPSG
jgi:CBS domain-containing protein